MYEKKIELLLISGSSVIKVEHLECSYSYQSNYIIICENKDDSLICTPYELSRVKSFKITRQ